jgi:hypothetical protein
MVADQPIAQGQREVDRLNRLSLRVPVGLRDGDDEPVVLLPRRAAVRCHQAFTRPHF